MDTTKINRCGARPSEIPQDDRASGLLPRRGPPQPTGGHPTPPCQTRRQRARGKSTGLPPPRNHPRSGSTGRKDPQHLNILQANLCGLSNKTVELAELLSSKKIHVALLQETLHRAKNANTHITGYTFYGCECTNCRGIATYVRNDVYGTAESIKSTQPTDTQRVNEPYMHIVIHA